jgi:hypothetical protein
MESVDDPSLTREGTPSKQKPVGPLSAMRKLLVFSTYVRLRPLSEGPSPVLPAPRSLQPSAARAAVSATIRRPRTA